MRRIVKYMGFTPLEKAANFSGTRHKSGIRDGDYTQPFSIIRGQNSLTGFTLVELLMALSVMSIILTAVATLSFALGSASNSADNASRVQNRIRYATVRISELVRSGKMICRNASGNVVLWQADDNGDSKINPGEITSLEVDSVSSGIKLTKYHPDAAYADMVMTLGVVKTGIYKQWMTARSIPSSSVILIDNCSYIYFTTDVVPPFAKKLNVFLGIEQGGVNRDFQMTARLRCDSDYMIDISKMSLLNVDDDM